MALSNLHEWLVTALAAALIAASLSLHGLPPAPVVPSDTAVCEKPVFPAMSLMLSLH